MVANKMRTLCGTILAAAVAFAAFASHGITLPVCEVAERAQKEVSTYPGRVVPIAQVDVTPQVSGEDERGDGANLQD